MVPETNVHTNIKKYVLIMGGDHNDIILNIYTDVMEKVLGNTVLDG